MSELAHQYPVVLTQNVIWRDLDAFQHVNNAVYFRYFEDARIAYFEQAGMLSQKDDTGLGPILASTRCDFRAPLTYPDTVHIATRIGELHRRRFTMEFVVHSRKLDRLAAEGEGLIVFYDYRNQQSCEIPQDLVETFERLERDVHADG